MEKKEKKRKKKSNKTVYRSQIRQAEVQIFTSLEKKMFDIFSFFHFTIILQKL